MDYVYIVECADGTYYTGWTNDLENRVNVHNSKKGAKYTRSRTPVKLVYYEEFEDKREAQSREWHVKRLSRVEKSKLIEGFSGLSDIIADSRTGDAESNHEEE